MNQTDQSIENKVLNQAVVRFCGDSGDGMQLTGSQFTQTSGTEGNDLMTFPDFPAEIRAPQGTLAGVSGFQIQLADHNIFTPGDDVDALVVMNPAAYKSNLASLKQGGVLIINIDTFDKKNLAKVGYDVSPLDDDSLKETYTLIKAPISQMTSRALEDLGLSRKESDRSKNFFALGITYWLFHKDLQYTLDWIEVKFKKKELIKEANTRSLKAGFNYAETCELFTSRFKIRKAKLPAGYYRNITGGTAIALGLTTAGQLADLEILFAGYPITPASEILHELNRYRNYKIRTFQAEDEIAAVCAAIGASFAGTIGITASSGPGIALKMEAIGLALMVELPLVIINAQRGGPSTGLPTKTEQADLLQSVYGRNGESPTAVIACKSPADSFETAIEAVRLALLSMSPVFLLTDGYLMMGSEPWKLPDINKLEKIKHNRISKNTSRKEFQIYKRDPKTLARLWPVPGDAGFEHRIGGIEKDQVTGNVSYDPQNHQEMVKTRAQKIQNLENHIPDQYVNGDAKGKILIIGWGSTHGSIMQAVTECRENGISVSHAHLRHIHPFAKNLGEILSSFEKILVPELNNGQLVVLLRNKFQNEFKGLNKIKGRPFLVSEIVDAIKELDA